MSAAHFFTRELERLTRLSWAFFLWRVFSLMCFALMLVLVAGAPTYLVFLFVPIVWLAQRPLGTDAVVERMDTEAGLHGALVCAWDNRVAIGPVLEAQRDLAHRGYMNQAPSSVLVSPSWGWWGPPLMLCVFLVVDGSSPLNGGPTDVSNALPESTAKDLSRLEQGDSLGSRAPQKREARGAATSKTEATPDFNGSDAERPEEQMSAAGKGKKASDKKTVASTVRHQNPARFAGAAINLRTTAGTEQAQAASAGRMLVGQTPPPIDSIVDPARPYPRRYHSIINSWFERTRP